jgi:Nif-specific regulatory protein
MAGKTQENSPALTQEDFQRFCEVSNAIHAIRNLDQMLRSILRNIREIFHIEGASIALHDPDQKEFYFIRTVEEEKDGAHLEMEKMRFPDHLGVAGWVLKQNEPVIIPDASRDPRILKQFDLENRFVTRSMVCVPLRTRKASIGVLYALNKLQGAFTERDVRLLEVLSGTIAIAIENARLNGEIQSYARTLAQENRQLKSEAHELFNLQGIIGNSPSMRRIFALLQKVLDTATPVLIQGETGTGKELVAKAIHYNGFLKDHPFIAENCGALAENLLESELFGHVKGAFTGAVASRKGLFELADGGTIFLDEIGEMGPAMQVKLLRVLQEGEFRPVGSTQYRSVNVRVIASTNRDLEEEVREGNFRADLLYRINVFPITLPPLRERREDIPLLAAHFLEKFAGKQGRPAARLMPRAMELLSRYDWPGNIRELENEIERALTLAGPAPEVGETYLSRKIHGVPDLHVAIPDPRMTLPEVTALVERQMISDALRSSGGNKSQAARILGITRQGLFNKIVRHGIEA